MRIAEAFVVVVEMFERVGKTWSPYKDSDRCLEHEFAPWSVALNGSEEPRADCRGGMVPPFAILVRHEEMPVGIIGTAGGSMIADGEPGEAERRFIEAVKAVASG